MYQVGYRALQSHGTGLGGGAADANQQLGYISTGTNTVGVAQPDFNNQYMYVGTNSTTLGALSKIQLNSDTNIKTYNSSANVPSGGTLLIDEDVTSLGVGYQLEAVGSAASGVKSMAPDNNANALTGSLFSETQTLASSTKFAYLWTSFATDAQDSTSAINVYACNAYSSKSACDSGSGWVLGTWIQTDTNQDPDEREYSFSFPAAGSYLTVKFDFSRGSTKTNTYIARYGATWASSVGGADIAERYRSSEPVYPGDILSVTDPPVNGEATVALSRIPYDQKLIGVVTTNPAIVMDSNLVDLNFNAASRNSPDRPAVALAGRVPIKVSTANGPIAVGDPITSSNIPGVGIKATKAGTIIAKALQNFSCPTTEDATALGQPDAPCTGTVEAYINTSWFDPDTQLTSSDGLIVTKINEVFRIVRVAIDGAESVIERIGAFSELVSSTIRAGLIRSNAIQTDTLSPIASDSAGIAVRLGSTQTFTITNHEGTPSASFDSLGNATFSGELHADTLVVHDDATISGMLYADRIQTSFGDLNDRFASLETNLLTVSSASSHIAPPPIIVASSESAALAAAVQVENDTITVNTSLFVLGDTMLSRTTITGSLLIDGVIRFADNVVETLSDTFYIQKNRLANVDILDGTVLIDTLRRIFFRGDVAVSGNTTVAGVLGTNTLAPLGDGNLTIDLARPIPDLAASPSSLPTRGFGDLLIRGTDDRVVAKIDASGSATFTGNLTIEGATRLLGPVQLTTNSLGTSVAVSEGNTSLEVAELTATDTNYSVFATPSWDTSVWVAAKTTGGFTIQFSTAAPAGATVDWLILLNQAIPSTATASATPQ
ncbi:MAG: hypothetical protein AB1772_13270 [Candidatus Zixiibacteriota bacterium]